MTPPNQQLDSHEFQEPLQRSIPYQPITSAPSVPDMEVTSLNDRNTSPPSEASSEVKLTSISGSLHFVLVFSSLCVTSFVSALDLTTVSTVLPSIVADLQAIPSSKHGHLITPAPSSTSVTDLGGSYIWIGSAYSIGGMAILPMTGTLSEIWGRKLVLIGSLVFFLIGSIVCATSQSMPVLIAGRALQGVGDGGIISLAEIIVADLVSLSERGTYEGILGLVWASASAVGPPIGGLFNRHRRWRWIFYLNIPITVIAIFLISMFMNMKKPQTDMRTKLKQMDWYGLVLLIAASVLLGLSMTWGGSRYPWTSAPVLTMLIIGVILFAAFFYLELFIFKNPTVPRTLLSNRTSAAAHATALLHGLVTMAIIYLLPTYFQAVKLATTIKSGLMVLPFSCTVALTAIGFSVSIELLQRYLPQNHIGWLFTVAGVPLLLLLDTSTRMYAWVLVQFPIAIGCGALFVAPQFPALAAVPIQLTSKALAVQLFFASFGQMLGILLGEAIFQSSMISSIRSPLIQNLQAQGAFPFDINQVASPFSVHLGALHRLSPEASLALRNLYSKAIQKVWILLIPFSVLGWIACAAMKEIEMHEEVDERFAAQESLKHKSSKDLESIKLEPQHRH